MRTLSTDLDADIPPPSRAALDTLADREGCVLLVGSDHPMHAALAAALARHEVNLETAPAAAVLDAVLAATPKLILLVGEAARDGGAAVLERLRTLERAEDVPVVVLAADHRLETRVLALKSGAAAVIPPSASVDAIASEAAELARAGSEQEIRASMANKTTLREVLDVFGKTITTRILATDATSTEPEHLEIVLREGVALSELFDEFSERLAPLVLEAERIQYQLGKDESAGELLGEGEFAIARSTSSMAGVRVLLADPDSVRADAIARALRSHGADVVVAGLFPDEEQLRRMRQFDPGALLVRAKYLATGNSSLVDQMKRDSRLRWATPLIGDWEDEPHHESDETSLQSLLAKLALLRDAETSLAARAEAAESFETHLEILGPARSLRALAGCTGPLRMTIENPCVTVRVEFGDGLIFGAHADLHEPPAGARDGAQALSALLALQSGRVAVEPIQAPTVLNLVTTIGSALDIADSTPAPIQTSVLPPGDPFETASRRPLAPPNASASKNRRVYVVVGLTAAMAGAAMTFISFPWTASHPRSPSADHVVLPAGPSRVASPSSGDPLEPVAARKQPPGASAAVAPEPEASLIERALVGHAEAIVALELKPPAERTVEETIALAHVRAAASRRALSILREQALSSPDALKSPAVVRQWLGYARDPATALDALPALATIPGSRSADLIYELWLASPGRSAAKQLAEELIKTDEVRRKASPALAVALDLRSADTCEEAKTLLPRALADADRRSLRQLLRLDERRGCGPNKRGDCYPCLRQDDDARLLADAIRAARKRVETAIATMETGY